MIVVHTTPKFNRAYKKLLKGNPSLAETYRSRTKAFVTNPSDPSLETHKLKGKLKGSLAFSITDDLRIVFEYDKGDSNSVLFLNTGPHDDVY